MTCLTVKIDVFIDKYRDVCNVDWDMHNVDDED